MLDRGADTGFELLDFVNECVDGVAGLVQFPAISWAHGCLLAHTGVDVGTLVGALITRIGMDNAFLPVQQTIAFGGIGHMACRAAHGMDQARVSIYCNVRLRPQVPLIAFFARMHLEVALAPLVLHGTRRGNQSRIHRAALPVQQALRAEQVIDTGQDGIGQLALLQPVAKSEDDALLKHAPIHIELGKLTVQRHVKEGFLHRRVRQAGPLLKEMRAQHRLQGKGRPAGTTLGVVRRDKRDQRGPESHPLHLLQELAFAGFLHTEREVQGGLLHSLDFLRLDLHQSHKRLSYAEFP